MIRDINIEIEGSVISLSLNEFWYFRYYIKNVSHFYDKLENKSKKVMIKFPGTSFHFVADRKEIKNISNQVKTYIDRSFDQFHTY